MAPRTPYGLSASRILSRRLVQTTAVTLLVAVATLLQIFQLTPWRLLTLDVFSGISFAWLLKTVSVFLATAGALALKTNFKTAERYIPKGTLAAASNNIISVQFAIQALFYAFSAAWIIPSYISWMFPSRATAAYFYPDGPKLPAQLSERHLFSRLFALWLGVLYTVEATVRDNSYLVFPAVQRIGWKKPKLPITSLIQQAGRAVLGYEVIFVTFYAIFGGLFYSVYWSSYDAFIGLFVNLRYDHSSWEPLLDVGFLFTLFVAGTLCVTCWEAADRIFDRDFTETVDASEGKPDPNAHLVTGLTRDNPPYIRYLAFLELHRAVRFRPDRRGDIFADVDSNPTKWSRVLQECIFVIQETAIAAEERLEAGKSTLRKTDNLPAQTTRLSSVRSNLSDKVTPLRTIQLKPLPATPVAKPKPGLLGSLSRAIGAGAEVLTPRKPYSADPRSPIVNVPNILRTDSQKAEPAVEAPAPPRSPSAGSAPATEVAKALPSSLLDKARQVPILKKLIDSDLGRALLSRKDQYAAIGVVAKSQLVVLAIRSLCDLASFSYSEDAYGLVQRDLPRILEALLRCLAAMEKLKAQSPRLPVGMAQAYEHEVAAISEALNSGLYQISTTFYENLRLFNLPPKTTEALQVYVDFRK